MRIGLDVLDGLDAIDVLDILDNSDSLGNRAHGNNNQLLTST